MCEAFVGEYLSVSPQTCRVLSQMQWLFLGGISGKYYSGRVFQKFCANQGYPLPKHVKIRPNFCNFILGPYRTEKNSNKYFHMLFAPGKEACHKEITKRRYGEENPGRLVFGKPILYTLGLELTMPYSLGILV